MRTRILLVGSIIGFALLMIQANIIKENISPKALKVDTSAVSYSGKVKTIIDNKCYGCHNSKAWGVKARVKLNWDSLALVSKASQLSKLDKIIETLDKGEMPPKQFIEKKPEAKMTDDEIVALKSWAQKASDVLLK